MKNYLICTLKIFVLLVLIQVFGGFVHWVFDPETLKTVWWIIICGIISAIVGFFYWLIEKRGKYEEWD